jgi:hypothetical protein
VCCTQHSDSYILNHILVINPASFVKIQEWKRHWRTFSIILFHDKALQKYEEFLEEETGTKRNIRVKTAKGYNRKEMEFPFLFVLVVFISNQYIDIGIYNESISS